MEAENICFTLLRVWNPTLGAMLILLSIPTQPLILPYSSWFPHIPIKCTGLWGTAPPPPPPQQWPLISIQRSRYRHALVFVFIYLYIYIYRYLQACTSTMVLGLHVGYGDEFLLQWCILSCPPRTDQIISQCYRLEWLWKKTTFTENKGLHALHVWFNNCPNLLINPTFVWKGVATVGVVMKNKRDVCGVQGWDVMKTLSLWCAAHFLWQWNKGRLLNHHNRNVRVSVRVYVCVCVCRSVHLQSSKI